MKISFANTIEILYWSENRIRNIWLQILSGPVSRLISGLLNNNLSIHIDSDNVVNFDIDLLRLRLALRFEYLLDPLHRNRALLP
jgi:hypothetical protein